MNRAQAKLLQRTLEAAQPAPQTGLRRKRVRDLVPGDVVVDCVGGERTVTGPARACVAPGYYRAETTGEPVNTHGDNLVDVRVQP